MSDMNEIVLVADQIRAIKEGLGLTWREISYESDLTMETIYKMLAHKHVSSRTLQKIKLFIIRRGKYVPER